jgi:hypothetical protein
MKKTFHIQHNVGNAKHVVNYHNGTTTHPDGSPFFHLKICATQKELDDFTSELRGQGYNQPPVVNIYRVEIEHDHGRAIKLAHGSSVESVKLKLRKSEDYPKEAIFYVTELGTL